MLVDQWGPGFSLSALTVNPALHGPHALTQAPRQPGTVGAANYIMSDMDKRLPPHSKYTLMSEFDHHVLATNVAFRA